MQPALGLLGLDLLKRLTFDDAVALHDAYPDMNSLWDYRYYPVLLKHHLPNSEHLSITNEYGTISFEAYVKFVHWHSHAILNHYQIPPRYRTSINSFAGLYGQSQETYLVKSCIFLPKSAPGIFSNNLVIVTATGCVTFYRPHLIFNNFLVSAVANTDHVPDNLAVSPGGSMVLLASSEQSYLISLSVISLKMYGLRVELDAFTFGRKCFVNEHSFIEWNGMDVLLHSLVTTDCNEKRLKTTVFLSGFHFGIERAPLTRNTQVYRTTRDYFRNMRISAQYIPAAAGAGCCDYLLFGYKHDENGFGGILRLIPNPHSFSFSSKFIHFKQSVICSAAVNPDNTRMYVTVLFDDKFKEMFFDESTYPEINAEERVMEDSLVYGRIGVYEIILDETELQVRPRFYMGPQKIGVTIVHPAANQHHQPNWSIGYNMSHSIQTICSKYHLHIKMEGRIVAHFSLIASRWSVPCYESVLCSLRWATSEDDTHSFYSNFTPANTTKELHQSALMECRKYQNRDYKYNRFHAGREISALHCPVEYI